MSLLYYLSSGAIIMNDAFHMGWRADKGLTFCNDYRNCNKQEDAEYIKIDFEFQHRPPAKRRTALHFMLAVCLCQTLAARGLSSYLQGGDST